MHGDRSQPEGLAPATLIESLRRSADRMRGWTYSGDADPDPRILMREAAAEITRLRGALNRERTYRESQEGLPEGTLPRV